MPCDRILIYEYHTMIFWEIINYNSHVAWTIIAVISINNKCFSNEILWFHFEVLLNLVIIRQYASLLWFMNWYKSYIVIFYHHSKFGDHFVSNEKTVAMKWLKSKISKTSSLNLCNATQERYIPNFKSLAFLLFKWMYLLWAFSI